MRKQSRTSEDTGKNYPHMEQEKLHNIPHLVSRAQVLTEGQKSKWVKRDTILTAVMLVLCPECIKDNSRIPRKVASALSEAMGINRSCLSRIKPSLSTRYRLCPGDRDRAQSIASILEQE